MSAAMLVRYFMSRGVRTVDEGLTCLAALRELRAHSLRRAPVVRDGRLAGIVCLRDLLRVLPGTIAQAETNAGHESESLPVSRVMATKLVTVGADDHIETAARAMLEHKVGGLPVLHKGELVGIVTESDIFRAFTRMLDPAGVLRVTFGFLEAAHGSPDLAELVARATGTLVGLQTYARPGGQRLVVLRMRGGSKDALLDALTAAGCQLMEVLDAREADAA